MTENNNPDAPEPQEGSNQDQPDEQPPDLCFSKDSCQRRSERIRPYRIFISYSHDDRWLSDKLEKHLKKEGLLPINDREIRIGETFSQEIREMIECVHVFMPLITQDVDYRQWVQQEIGYAMALHVPVCPIAIGNLPAGMTEQIQGIHIDLASSVGAEDGESPEAKKAVERLKERLTYDAIDDLVQRARKRTRQGRYDCAMCWTEREEMLIEFTNAARRQNCGLIDRLAGKKSYDRDLWRLRQRTAFGSFSIPDTAISSDAWRIRDPNRYHTEEHRRLLRAERQAMSEYMRCFGCDLIIDPRVTIRNPTRAHQKPRETQQTGLDDEAVPNTESADAPGSTTFKHSPLRTVFRIRLLIDLILRHLDDDMLRVVVPPHPGSLTTNLMIVGDWFATEAVVPHYGGGAYERTMFTRHAPTVLNMIDRFDQDFRDCLPNPGHDSAPSEAGPEDASGDANTDSALFRTAKKRVLSDLRKWQKRNEENMDEEQRGDMEKVCEELGLRTEKDRTGLGRNGT